MNASMKTFQTILKREEVVGGRVVADIHHHQARRVRPQGALVAPLGHQEEPNLGAAVAVVARVALVGPPGKWVRNVR